MDATFLVNVRGDYPAVRFVKGARFSFRPPRTVVFCDDSGDAAPLLLLHELGHFLTGRYSFKTEVERLKIEVMALVKTWRLQTEYLIHQS